MSVWNNLTVREQQNFQLVAFVHKINGLHEVNESDVEWLSFSSDLLYLSKKVDLVYGGFLPETALKFSL